MAGDWLKVEKDTPEKPEVLAAAAALGLDPEIVFAKCFKLWRWADSNLSEGNARGVTLALVDGIVGCPGFAEVLVKVGWLRVRTGSLELPHFDRHMGKSAKKRALGKERSASHRNASSVTEASPEKSKRREERSVSSNEDTDARQPRPRNELWDVLCDLFSLNPQTRTEEKRVGKAVSELRQKSATPDEVRKRFGRYQSAWPEITCSPEALLKHWDWFGQERPEADHRSMLDRYFGTGNGK